MNELMNLLIKERKRKEREEKEEKRKERNEKTHMKCEYL
jgi:hypothetical protein